VQGVGFRWFVEKNANSIGVRGWVRNEDDGRVQVYATGYPEQLNRLAALLHQGPRMADVRGVEEQEAPVQQLSSFRSE
jgi:acylphosphatase